MKQAPPPASHFSAHQQFRSPDGKAGAHTYAEPVAEHGAGAPRRAPGRLTVCTPSMLGMLCGVIRELGLSPSAAAERLGFGVSTLSRWRRQQPEVALALKQAREECRALHLMRIIETSQAASGKGWRASAWILERLFPEDYAPSATQREKFRALAERRRTAEELESETAELEDLMDAARAPAEGAADCADVADEAELREGGEGEDGSQTRTVASDASSEGDCQNCQNPCRAECHVAPRDERISGGASHDAFGDDCRNCQNSTGTDREPTRVHANSWDDGTRHGLA